MEDFAFRVEFYQLLVRPVGEVEDQVPGFGWVAFVVVVIREGWVVAGCLRGVAAGEEIVEQTDGVVPFQRHALEGEPAVGGRDIGRDERCCEEGVQAGKEEGEIGKARVVHLVDRVSNLNHLLQ